MHIGSQTTSLSDPYDAIINSNLVLPREQKVLELFLKLAKPLKSKAEFLLDHVDDPVGLIDEHPWERNNHFIELDKYGKFPFSASGKARILNETSGFVKIVGEKKYDEVLGVHIIGPRATELIAEAAAALRLEATSEELVRTIHAHPTLSEAIHEAAEGVEGQPIHI